MKFQMIQPIEPAPSLYPDGNSMSPLKNMAAPSPAKMQAHEIHEKAGVFEMQKKMQRAHQAHALMLGVWFACSLWSAFSRLARSAHLVPSACFWARSLRSS